MLRDPLEGADHGPDVTEPDALPEDVRDAFLDWADLLSSLARAERAEREAA